MKKLVNLVNFKVRQVLQKVIQSLKQWHREKATAYFKDEEESIKWVVTKDGLMKTKTEWILKSKAVQRRMKFISENHDKFMNKR